MAESADASNRREATTWLGVGAFGVLVAAVGIFIPALSSIPLAGDLRILLGFGGGVTAYYGFWTYYQERAYEAKHPIHRPLKGRAKDLAIAPSFEVYNPRLARPEEPPALPERPPEP